MRKLNPSLSGVISLCRHRKVAWMLAVILYLTGLWCLILIREILLVVKGGMKTRGAGPKDFDVRIHSDGFYVVRAGSNYPPCFPTKKRRSRLRNLGCMVEHTNSLAAEEQVFNYPHPLTHHSSKAHPLGCSVGERLMILPHDGLPSTTSTVAVQRCPVQSREGVAQFSARPRRLPAFALELEPRRSNLGFS